MSSREARTVWQMCRPPQSLLTRSVFLTRVTQSAHRREQSDQLASWSLIIHQLDEAPVLP